MKALAFLGFWWLAHVTSAPSQIIQTKSVTTRTIPTTKQPRLDRELLRFLLFTHEADATTSRQALFHSPLLVSTLQTRIGVYKFGLNAAHAGYNVVFQYRHQLVFSSARTAAPLLAHLRHFLRQYPTAFSAQAQRTVEAQLWDIVERNQSAGESDLPSR
jgi:hypothetical protein